MSENIPQGQYQIRLRPPSGSVFGPVDFTEVFTFDNSILDLGTFRLLPQVDFLGKVQPMDGSPIQARVTAQALAGITQKALTFLSSDLKLSGEPAFRISLPPWWPQSPTSVLGMTYKLKITPDSSLLPPWEIDLWSVPFDENLEPFQLPRTGELPNAPKLPSLKGQVLVSQKNPTPLQGIRVSAQDAEGHTLSTTATTDMTGQFRLIFWPSTASRLSVLRVSSSDPKLQPLPTVWHAVGPEALTEPEHDTESNEIDAPVVEPQGIFQQVFQGDIGTSFEAHGHLSSENGQPIASANLIFLAQVGNGTYETKTLTDSNGNFSATLYTGNYEIQIEPPLDENLPARLTRRQLFISEETENLSIQLNARSQVVGQIQNAAHENLAETRIQSNLIEARFDEYYQGDTELPLPSRRTETLSDANGNFTLLLDPGLHRLTVHPTQGSGLPTASYIIQVPVSTPLVELPHPLIVPGAALVRLTLQDEQGNPTPDVIAELWDVTPGQTAHRVAQGQSDHQGDVRIRLANP